MGSSLLIERDQDGGQIMTPDVWRKMPEEIDIGLSRVIHLLLSRLSRCHQSAFSIIMLVLCFALSNLTTVADISFDFDFQHRHRGGFCARLILVGAGCTLQRVDSCQANSA